MICTGCSNQFNHVHDKSRHTHSVCEAFKHGYDKTLYSNATSFSGLPNGKTKKKFIRDNFCPVHVTIDMLRGRVCPRCRPNCTVLGMSQKSIWLASNHQFVPVYSYLYTISNGVPNTTPGAEALTRNVILCGKLISPPLMF